MEDIPDISIENIDGQVIFFREGTKAFLLTKTPVIPWLDQEIQCFFNLNTKDPNKEILRQAQGDSRIAKVQ